MASPRVLILRAPGTNCDEETAFGFEQAGAVAERVHVNRLIENRDLADRYQILCLPGGFSFGDDIAAGRILASRLRRHLGEMVERFVGGNGDRLVLGICNGMQVLMRLGALTAAAHDPETRDPETRDPETRDPEAAPATLTSPATLTWNDHGRFEDRWVRLAVDETPCVFLRGIERLYLPIAHAEGKFVTADPAVLQRLRAAGRLPLRYVAADADAISDDVLPFPANPNGSLANVAGVCDDSGRVFGLMPHPERHIDPLQHPAWTRRDPQPDAGDGLALFRNAVDWFA